MTVEHHKPCKPPPPFKTAQSLIPLLHPTPFRMAQVLPSRCELDEQKGAPSEVKATCVHLKQLMELQNATLRFSLYLAFIRFLALSSQCSETVRSSCSFAIAFSTAG